MGFAAIARVTEDRWIACQVMDKIEFGMAPGDELEVSTTICNDIRACGQAIVIDHVAADEAWRTHPTPILYGFESYASFPIILDDGSFLRHALRDRPGPAHAGLRRADRPSPGFRRACRDDSVEAGLDPLGFRRLIDQRAPLRRCPQR